ncbi:MAG: Gfo/Idh/MocA family oxidoreductase [Armatimonadetes bacterium]|nr:Gfo/Idh/MocA family oxidoreductase [Armatimonadota bacterium]
MSEYRLRVGVIGVGIRGQHAYEQFLAARPDCEIVAVAQQPSPVPELLEGKDPEETARQWADHLRAEYTADFGELLARPDIDLISLMCDPAASPALMAAAAEAGKHIIRDKLIANTVAGAEKAVAACERAGVQALITYNLRYCPAVATALQRVAAGEIGRPLAATFVYMRGDGPLEGFTATEAYRRVVGGGELTTFGVYAADVLLELLSGEMPQAVFASTGCYFYPDYADAGLEDMGQVTLLYSDGRIGHFITGRTVTSPTPDCYFRLEVTGTRGTMTVAGPEAALMKWRQGRQVVTYEAARAVHAMLDDFIGRLRSGLPSPIPPRRGLEVLAIIRAAYLSANRRQPVAVTEAS